MCIHAYVDIDICIILHAYFTFPLFCDIIFSFRFYGIKDEMF